MANNLPLAAAFATVPVLIMILYLLGGPAPGRLRVALMHLSRTTRVLLRIGTGITLAFMYVPLAVIALYAFNSRRTLKWPIPGLTLEWFDKAFHNPGVRDALLTSLKAATGATLVALLLGTLASLRRRPHRFFGRETISFLVILPIALPGVVTGMALNATFREVLVAARHRARPVHGDRRPRHVLHRRDLQQRDRAAAAHVGLVRGGVGGPRRRARGRRSGWSRSRRCARRWWRARCSRSRCRSTR